MQTSISSIIMRTFSVVVAECGAGKCEGSLNCVVDMLIYKGKIAKLEHNILGSQRYTSL